jgi:hypothetical protein
MAARLFLQSLLALVTSLLVAVPKVRAEPIQWGYQGQIVTTGPSGGFGSHVLIAAEPNAGPPGFPTVLSVPDIRVEFGDVAGSGTGSTPVTVFQMRVNSYDINWPFTRGLDTFTLSFGILDKASGATGTVKFQGTLAGIVGINGETITGFANLQVGFTGATQQSLVLGGHVYQVSISPYNFLSSGPWQTPYVTPYQGVPINVQVSDVPEPSTLALAAIGLSGIGLRAWRRRRAPDRNPGR